MSAGSMRADRGYLCLEVRPEVWAGVDPEGQAVDRCFLGTADAEMDLGRSGMRGQYVSELVDRPWNHVRLGQFELDYRRIADRTEVRYGDLRRDQPGYILTLVQATLDEDDRVLDQLAGHQLVRRGKEEALDR